MSTASEMAKLANERGAFELIVSRQSALQNCWNALHRPNPVEVDHAVSLIGIMCDLGDCIGDDVCAIATSVPGLLGHKFLESAEYDRFGNKSLEPYLIKFRFGFGPITDRLLSADGCFKAVVELGTRKPTTVITSQTTL
jgi:hypothetical protein